MRYTTEIIVEVPRGIFVSKMRNNENLKYWQRGLISTEHLSGNPGDLGSKMQLNYEFRNRKMSLTETITKVNWPSMLHTTYKMKGMNNIQENHFEPTEDGYTKWICFNEFIPLNLRMRLFTLFMPTAFKKQTLKYMQDFKNFAENGTIVNNAKN